MPTYEYKCTACGHAFEQFQSITAAPVKRCPQCGKAKVKRLVSIGAGVIFKGSGFYITDYRDASYKEKAKADSGDAGSGGSDSSAGSDGKGETKSGGETKSAETKSASAESKSETKPAASKPAKSDKPEKKSKK